MVRQFAHGFRPDYGLRRPVRSACRWLWDLGAEMPTHVLIDPIKLAPTALSMAACELVRWNSLPSGCTVFLLVVRELFDAGVVGAHDKDLAVRLWRIGVRRFIFEAHPGTCKRDVLTIGPPGHMSVVSIPVRQTLQIAAVRSHRARRYLLVGCSMGIGKRASSQAVLIAALAQDSYSGADPPMAVSSSAEPKSLSSSTVPA